MSTDEYVPDEEFVREQYSREQPPHIGTVSEKRAEFDRFLARVRRDAVEEYKDRQVQIHITPEPPRTVLMPMRCPKCGYC